jgi:hypothetical protein
MLGLLMFWMLSGWQTLDVKRLENKLIMILNNHTAPNLNEFFCKRNTIQSN